MRSNVKRTIFSLALMVAFGSARADELRSTAPVSGDAPRRLASAAVQPSSAPERDTVSQSDEAGRTARVGRDDERRSDAATTQELNHRRFLQEVWTFP